MPAAAEPCSFMEARLCLRARVYPADRALRDWSLRLLDARAATDAGLAGRRVVGRALLLDA